MTRKSNIQPQKSKNFPERLRGAIKALCDAIAKLVEWAILPMWGWLGVRWDRLSPKGQKAVFACLWLAGVAFGVYSAWVARLHNATAPVVRWGWLRVEARYGMLLLMPLLFFPATIVIDRFNEKRGKNNGSSTRRFSLLRCGQERLLPPLAHARWLYLRHQDTLALERTQALLALEPDNTAARELLALIEKRMAERSADAPNAPLTPPRAAFSDRLANSKFVASGPRFVVTAMLCLSCYGSYYYTRVGMGQGWQTVVWTGHDKLGNITQSSALFTFAECLLVVLVCGLYLVYGEGGFANTTIWKKVIASRSAKRNGQSKKPVESKS